MEVLKSQAESMRALMHALDAAESTILQGVEAFQIAAQHAEKACPQPNVIRLSADCQPRPLSLYKQLQL